MTSLDDIALPRPAATPDAGPLDARLVRPRGGARPPPAPRQPDARDVPRHPHRGRAPGRRRAAMRVLAASSPTERGASRRRSRRSTRPGSPEDARFERDLEVHNTRSRDLRDRRDPDLGAAIDRRSTPSAMRCSWCSPATMPRWPERLEAITEPARGHARRFLQESSPGPSCPQVRPWQELEIERRAEMSRACSARSRRRPRAPRPGRGGAAGAPPSPMRREAVDDYGRVDLQTTLADGTDDWALGRSGTTS